MASFVTTKDVRVSPSEVADCGGIRVGVYIRVDRFSFFYEF